MLGIRGGDGEMDGNDMRLRNYYFIKILFILTLYPTSSTSQNFVRSESFLGADINVNIVEHPIYADLSIHITQSMLNADVNLYPALCQFGVGDVFIYLSSSILGGEVDVYINESPFDSDIYIYLTSDIEHADEIICFSEQVSTRKVHELAVAAAAYLYKNKLLHLN